MNYRSGMERIGSKSDKKEAILGNFPRVYRYRYRGVPVHPIRDQPVPVQVQPVPVQANRMQPVPVQVQGVPVQVSPKCPKCCVFV